MVEILFVVFFLIGRVVCAVQFRDDSGLALRAAMSLAVNAFAVFIKLLFLRRCIEER